MDFLVFYPKGKNLFIEFIPDKYIGWQPVTEKDISEKVSEVGDIITELKDYCKANKVDQVIVIDCDKAIQFDSINYVLACKLVNGIQARFPDHENILKRIEIRHCHPAIRSIVNTCKPLLPKRVSSIFQVYS